MPENQKQKPFASHDERSIRAPLLFAEFSRVRQVVSLLVIPIVFGVVAALTLKWTAPAWWTWQALGALGAVLAGLEHRRRRSAALRGAVGGLLAAMTVVCFRVFLTGEDVTEFNPVSFPLFAVIASAGLHAGGAMLRRPARPAPDVTTHERAR
ncbi:hypothetical protein [Amycolatopsis pigmentata]|uniref:Uncharacterized protein n=1 Tax=Amycolatopsis pigmentata TaxID=450801 RepID=A0ABW5G378_9PSEU